MLEIDFSSEKMVEDSWNWGEFFGNIALIYFTTKHLLSVWKKINITKLLQHIKFMNDEWWALNTLGRINPFKIGDWGWGEKSDTEIVRIICSWNSFLCQTWNLCISCCHHGRWARTRATLTIGQVLASNHWRRHTSSTIGISESDLIEIKISFWSRGLYNQLVCVGQQSRRGSDDFRVIWHNLQHILWPHTIGCCKTN